MRKPVPLKLTADMQNSISAQLNVQEERRTAPKSLDKDFPVFEIPVNKKVLIYVPNHVVEGEKGPELRMDKPLIHTILDGKRFLSYRCVSGLVVKGADGSEILDGSCPLCDGTALPWDLANAKIKQKCKQLGLSPDDKENPSVKAIRSAEFSDRVIKEANRYYTFPIAVFKTVNDDGKTFEKDETGKPIIQIVWYHISESQYNDKWVKCFEGMEDEPTHPGGHFFTLSYVYDTKGKDANKRDSARNLTVIAKNPKGSDKIKAHLDKLTENWTPEKAREVVVSNLLYSLEELQGIADSVLETPTELYSLLQASEVGGSDTTVGGFNLKPQAETPAIEAASTPVAMDETDEDVDFG